jgi:hypothetical protein
MSDSIPGRMRAQIQDAEIELLAQLSGAAAEERRRNQKSPTRISLIISRNYNGTRTATLGSMLVVGFVARRPAWGWTSDLSVDLITRRSETETSRRFQTSRF